MRAILIAAAIGLLSVGAAARAEVVIHGPEKTAREILAAELAFEAKADKDGVGKAFRDTMDPIDGLEFAGGDPARGEAAIYKSHGGDAPEKAKLHWQPTEVFASTGDMGVTWGRWQFTPIGAAKPLVTGRYVTVWRRDAKGVWKGLIDIGNPD